MGIYDDDGIKIGNNKYKVIQDDGIYILYRYSEGESGICWIPLFYSEDRVKVLKCLLREEVIDTNIIDFENMFKKQIELYNLIGLIREEEYVSKTRQEPLKENQQQPEPNS